MSPLLGRTDHAARTLPIATRETVRAHTRVLLRDHRRPLSWVLLWHGVAALVALVGPWVVGQIVEEVTSGGDSLSRIDVLVGVLVAAIIVQTVITWLARKASFVLSERIFARLREDFITSSVRLPLSTVERAGTGDLVARTTNDVDSLAHIIRFGIPAIVVALTTVAATTVAAVLTSPLAALAAAHRAAIVQVPTSRWYLAARRRRLPLGARVLRPAQRRRRRDRRGRPDDGCARAPGARAGGASARRWPRAATPSGTRSGCGCGGSPGWRSASSCRSRPRCCGAAGSCGTATSRRRPRPPSRSTSSSCSTPSAS